MTRNLTNVKRRLGITCCVLFLTLTGEVIVGQEAVAPHKKHPGLTETATSVDTRGFKRTTEQSPSHFGYHWNHSVESHFLVGDAMGKAMVELLKK